MRYLALLIAFAAIQLHAVDGPIRVLFLGHENQKFHASAKWCALLMQNLGRDGISDLRSVASRLGAGLVGLALLATLLVTQRQRIPRIESAPAADNVVTPVAGSLFTDYLVAFELTSVVLLVAVVGAVLLAKKRVQP